MASPGSEQLPYSGESAQDRLSYDHYLADAKRGKTALLWALCLMVMGETPSRPR